MSTFSTTATQAQRDAIDFNLRGRAISQASRQNTLRPGYNSSPFIPKQIMIEPTRPTRMVIQEKQEAPHAKIHHEVLQVHPGTKRGQRQAKKTSKDIVLPILPLEEFLKTSPAICELATPLNVFTAIHGLSHGQPCIGCAYDEHSKDGCPAKRELLIKKGLWK